MAKSKKFDCVDTKGISVFLNEHGYCVIKPQDDSVEAFRDIAEKFGLIQFHTKSDKSGVVGGGEPINKDWQVFKDDYHGELSSDFFPHTDGSFLNGMAYVDGVAKKSRRPNLSFSSAYPSRRLAEIISWLTGRKSTMTYVSIKLTY